MNQRDVLQSLSFGERVAEEELDELHRYFVKTEQWRRLLAGDVDIVFGPKGSGKSALYALLSQQNLSLAERAIFATQGENPRGSVAFAELKTDPPASAAEFKGMWKLFLLSLAGRVIKTQLHSSSAGDRALSVLREAELLPESGRLSAILHAVRDYARKYFRPSALQIGPGKITFAEPSADGRAKGVIPIDEVLELVDMAIGEVAAEVWILLDRLDVAFADSPELEENALRALFLAYLDMLQFKHLRLKVFLRDDIWRRITASGFREASHITRQLRISWNSDSLLNLAIQRLLRNETLVSYYNLEPDLILSRQDEQAKAFYRAFPTQVDEGKKKPRTWDWIVSHTKDGSGASAPREVIHMLNAARDAQLELYELGSGAPEGTRLFGGKALKAALEKVSTVRVEQTLYAEYPDLRQYIETLQAQKTSQTASSLARIWGKGESQARIYAERLVKVGFFELRGTREEPTYWVPFLYRDALHMVQGSDG